MSARKGKIDFSVIRFYSYVRDSYSVSFRKYQPLVSNTEDFYNCLKGVSGGECVQLSKVARLLKDLKIRDIFYFVFYIPCDGMASGPKQIWRHTKPTLANDRTPAAEQHVALLNDR